ncbi:MAG: chemotaxis protein CheA [Nitrospinae bacterium]|nr:chemotaxis protein CheA [Nitrospinota bacterium]
MAEDQMDEFLDAFIQESNERFEELNQGLVQLEEDTSNEETLYAIFRHVHSIKGNAGMFDFESLKIIAHRLEDLMELAHKNPKKVDRGIMDILFDGIDIMQSNVKRVLDSNASKSELTHRERSYYEHLDKAISQFSDGKADINSAIETLFQNIEALLPEVSQEYDTSKVKNSVDEVRSLMIKEEVSIAEIGASNDPENKLPPSFIGTIEVTDVLNRIHQALNEAKEIVLPAEKVKSFFQDISILLEAIEKLEIPSLLESAKDARESIEIFTQLQLDFDTLQVEYYLQILHELQPHIIIKTPQAEKSEIESGETEEIDQRKVKATVKKTVRVEETKIDAFLDSVGELIILGEVFNNLQKRYSEVFKDNISLLREFKAANTSYSQHIFSLQESLMDVRRVELRNITGTLNRLVRDATRSLDKKVDLVIEGEDAVIDKSFLDDVNTCLVHILRNGVDHGIETSEERIKAGKPETGTIKIIAVNEDGFFLLRILDDGKGINIEKLRQKMVDNGTHTKEEALSMSDKDVSKMIFFDGVSTAEEISDISGRGVGMAVVMNNIKKMNGVIDVKTRPGLGTEVSLRIPLSIMLSVVDGLVVKVCKESFIIPIRHVYESFNPQTKHFKTVQNKGECVMLRDQLYPLMRLQDYFEIEDDPTKEESLAVGILVKSEDDYLCLLVDNILDHQQVVIKSIDGLQKLKGIYGGALLGDGTIGLVLDIDSIAALR